MTKLQNKPVPAARRMSEYRERLRNAGLRQVQIWLPDTRSPQFAKACRKQASAIAARDKAGDAVMEFIDTAYDWPKA
jgi:Protein  of unknown function (DUF3018)